MITAGLLTAAAMLLVFIKLGYRKVLGYDLIVDIAFTVGLAYVFAGTYAGLMAAIIAGLVLSLVLLTSRKLLGAEKFDVKTRKWTHEPGLLDKVLRELSERDPR